MVEINLLPRELQRKRIKIPKIKFMPVIIWAIAFLVSLQLVVSLVLVVKRHNLKSLEAKWAAMAPEREELLSQRKEIKNLENKIRDIEALRAGRMLWAEKLNDLSDSMISGIWLTSLYMEEPGGKKCLTIKGSVSSYGTDEAAIVGRFMRALKDNKNFFNDFEEIKLGTIQQKKTQDMDAMGFSINCYFKAKK